MNNGVVERCHKTAQEHKDPFRRVVRFWRNEPGDVNRVIGLAGRKEERPGESNNLRGNISIP